MSSISSGGGGAALQIKLDKEKDNITTSLTMSGDSSTLQEWLEGELSRLGVDPPDLYASHMLDLLQNLGTTDCVEAENNHGVYAEGYRREAIDCLRSATLKNIEDVETLIDNLAERLFHTQPFLSRKGQRLGADAREVDDATSLLTLGREDKWTRSMDDEWDPLPSVDPWPSAPLKVAEWPDLEKARVVPTPETDQDEGFEEEEPEGDLEGGPQRVKASGDVARPGTGCEEDGAEVLDLITRSLDLFNAEMRSGDAEDKTPFAGSTSFDWPVGNGQQCVAAPDSSLEGIWSGGTDPFKRPSYKLLDERENRNFWNETNERSVPPGYGPKSLWQHYGPVPLSSSLGAPAAGYFTSKREERVDSGTFCEPVPDDVITATTGPLHRHRSLSSSAAVNSSYKVYPDRNFSRKDNKSFGRTIPAGERRYRSDSLGSRPPGPDSDWLFDQASLTLALGGPLPPLPRLAAESSDLETKWMENEGECFQVQRPRGPNKQPVEKWRRACSFHLRGHCKKEDCEFSHDLTKVTCKFWEGGDCFKGPTCPFLHGYPVELPEEDDMEEVEG